MRRTWLYLGLVPSSAVVKKRLSDLDVPGSKPLASKKTLHYKLALIHSFTRLLRIS